MEKQNIKNEVKEYLIDYLSAWCRGQENKASGKRLLENIHYNYTGFELSDREMRRIIAELRTTPEGCFILTTQKKGGGYYWAESIEELNEATQTDLNHCYTLMNKITAQRKRAGLLSPEQPQIKMRGF